MKKFYASAQCVPDRYKNKITEGKKYEIDFDGSIPLRHPDYGFGFFFTDDVGDRRYACELYSAHLDDGDWTITEESEGE